MRYQKDYKLFLAAGPLDFVAIDLLGPLPKTAYGSRRVRVMAEKFKKLTRSIPFVITNALVVANTFRDNWVYVYCAPRYVLTDKRPQVLRRRVRPPFCVGVNSIWEVRHYRTTAYHCQTNG